MAIKSEAELVDALRPGRDGLILAGAGKRAIFLPKVWSSLPDPRLFVRQLKLKAGLAADAWPEDMKAYHYVAETIG
jgi:AMMECR1 domain-containing protein